MERPISARFEREIGQNLEAAMGIGPMNNGFADRSLSHLGTPPY